ncbi:hypothetical protein ITI46_33990 [Streptomyces oryzae]|uniref:Uncharacterized protein n=1 Tax=Streptomyces oryzae TaxID=1434886 RepID=A0ABS3XMG6_9ACTN|nr:hypothetical protein [Streptomyces oryzae]MBO8196605.1 hypothetical protein [Streptomyces oryzae]
MEPLRQDDVRRLGPYALVGRLDSAGSEIRPTVSRFLGLMPGGDRTALVTTVLPESVCDAARVHRFRSEALAAQQIAAGVGAVGAGEGRAAPVWSASPYRPVLPLPTVIETYGPLRSAPCSPSAPRLPKRSPSSMRQASPTQASLPRTFC